MKTKETELKEAWMGALLTLGSVIFLLALGGYVLAGGGGGSGVPGMLLISLLFVVLASSLGMVLQLLRMHVYSGAILLLGLTGHLMGWKPETGVIIPGGIIVISGLILLVTFLKKYPVDGAGGEMPGERSAEQDA